ncbi:vacuolar protein sorting-associated protein 8 homolog [Microplitis mediator]|uniref:vacuolar protein sorting-associated protein 8 homolog n=1 Tax=Microplitis mediator TaxID=375433 RepID=UPI002557B540|nr:vacuolar protein sorting-associated protein 8 homolog [Microplitis mediator]XP_057331529.1 vacuolar protein sorting-associated protein 8 homolog [Microplitis mediator]
MAENGFESEIGSQENLAAEAINLDIDELDDTEYAIPAVDKLPSLESILTEPDCDSLSGTELEINTAVVGAATTAAAAASSSTSTSFIGEIIDESETTSVGSLLSLNSLTKPITRNPEFPLSGVILKHAIMRGITSQIKSASDKVNGGLASAVAAGGDMVVIGTSHGLILAFDSKQTLRWCNQEARHQGSVSSLGFNNDGTRLLAGFARGHILMIDNNIGKVLRVLTDVHSPGTAVLNVKFTDLPTLALCSDSGGSVFELTFKRIMGVRGCDSKCLFSGSRGEVCTLEPLLINNISRHPLKNYIIVALATLSKIIVVCIRPRIRVLLTHPLVGPPTAPPQISWQLVVIQSSDSSRVIDPVLALARETTIHFYQVSSEAGSRIRLSPLRRITLSYIICNLKWLNTRSLAILDTQERLHLLDVRTQQDLETIDMSTVGISYASSHFKGLSTGGNVSKAMALAGERASYNTVITYGNQLLLLGTKRLHIVFIRTWSERLRYLTLQKRYPEALSLGLSFYQDKGKAVVGLSGLKKVRKRMTFIKTSQILIQYMQELIKLPEPTIPTTTNDSNNDNLFNNNNENDIITTCVDYAVQLENIHLLFGPLWDLVCESTILKGYYLRALEGPLLDGSLPPRLPPLIAQQLVSLYDKEKKYKSLQTIIVLLEIDCLDIHQVTTLCRERCLWEGLIHLQTVALGDYTAPIHQLIPVLQNYLINSNKSLSSSLSSDCIKLGNALLVYASCCLAGRGFPRGDLPEGQSQRAKAQVLGALLSQHSSLAEDNERQYPYLRTLLRFDPRGFLDVIAMAFQEPEFKTEMGYRQRQRLIDILLSIVIPSTPLTPDNPDYLDDNKKALVLVFIANQIASTTVTLESNVLNQLVELLCTENINKTIKITRDEKLERENAVLQLIYNNKLNGITDNTLLNLAQRVNYYRISQVIYTARDDWISVCKCFISDCYRQHQVWPWLEKLSTSELTKVILVNITALVTIDVDRISNLIAKRIPTKINNIIEKLNNENNENNSRLEYSLLLSFYQLNQYKEDEQDYIKLELSTQHLERLLILMCEYEPTRVVNHMNGPHGCRLDQALIIVQNANHQEAIALMFEKMGNYQDAFELLLNKLQQQLSIYYNNNNNSNNSNIPNNDEIIITATINISGLCRRSAGNLDWMPLVETVLQPYNSNNNNNNNNRVEILRGKLLKVVLEALSGTNALSIVLERILKHPLATSGTVGDIRQLLTGVLTHSRYEQVLVEKTAKLVSLELHESLKKTLRDAGRACASTCTVCPVCRKIFSQSTDYTVFFCCGHGFHLQCLGDKKLCYKCLNDKGWAPVATNCRPESRPLPERPQIIPPIFMRGRDFTLKLAAPTVLPNLEGIF